MAWLKTQVSFDRSQENRKNRWLQNEYLLQLSVNMKIQQEAVFVLLISEYNIKIHFIWIKRDKFCIISCSLTISQEPRETMPALNVVWKALLRKTTVIFNINRQSNKISFVYLFLQLHTSIWTLLCTNNLPRKPKEPNKEYLRFQRAFKSKLCDWN